MSNSIYSFFSETQKAAIKRAVMDAELDTSGEIRVHIENECEGEVLDRAAFVFNKLNMHKTKLRNGVLFYLAVKNRKFAIIGDAGINQKVPDNFWDNIKQILLNHFRKEEFSEGLIKGILMAGEQLKAHFPYQKNDVNELSDDISFENN